MDSHNSYTYDAFISYRHCEPDKKVAETLHRILETFKVPAGIVKLSGKKRIQRVFRDRDELPTSSDLADNITKALDSSEYLIVVCSPRTPQSQWVLKEIDDFKALHGHDKILALLIEGEPYESFPEQLRFVKKVVTQEDGTSSELATEVEPLAADIRAATEKEMFKKLKTEILRLLSPMLNCRFDDLKQRHRERLIKTFLTVSISLSSFFLAFGAFSTYQALLINQKSQEISIKSEEISRKSDEILQKNEEITAQIKQTQISQSRYLADISTELYEEGDRFRAILAALEALPKELSNPDRPYVAEAEYALSQALGVYETDSYFDGDIVLDHNKPVRFIKKSPDSKTLLTFSDDGLLNTWNLADGKHLAAYEVYDPFLTESQAFFIDNNRIAAVTSSSIICIDINGAVIWQTEEYASDLALSSDSSILAFTYVDNLGIIDSASGESLLDISLNDFMDLESYDNYVSCLTLNDTGSLACLGTSFGMVYIFDTATGELRNTFETGYSNVTSLDFSEDGKLAATSLYWDAIKDVMGKGSGFLNVFSLKDSSSVISMEFPYSGTNNVVFHPYNPSWVVLLESEKLNVVDMTTGEIAYTFIHGDNITGYQVYDTFILSSSLDGTIRFWFYSGIGFEDSWHRVSRPNPISQVAVGGGKIAITYQNSKKVYLLTALENENTVKLLGHNASIDKASFSSDGSMALSQDYQEGELFLWDLVNKELLLSTVMDERIIESRFVASDGKILVALESGIVKLLSVTDFSLVSEIKCGSLKSLYFNSDLSLAVFETYSDGLTVCSTQDLTTINRFEEVYPDNLSITDGNMLFTVDRSSGVMLTDITTGDIKISHEDTNLQGGAISPDGKKCVLSYNGKTMKLYDVGTALTENLTLNDILFEATRLIFSPDSKLLFVGFDDLSVGVYDTRNGELLNTIGSEDFHAGLSKVIFSNDGKLFACIDEYSVAHIFDAGTLKMLASSKIKDIDSDFKTILSSWDYDVIVLPIYTTQMLLDEAKEQLNGRTLTTEERNELFIDP